MGWQDRDYYRGSGAGPTSPLQWLVSGSVPLGTWFGIDVRAHATMILYVAVSLIFPDFYGGFENAVTAMSILFGIVILHEFGHCFGSRLVGGNPTQILMHPLGGLASSGAPHRPWAKFFTVLAGPLVNVIICVVAAAVLVAMARSWSAIPWGALDYNFARLVWRSHVAYIVWWTFTVSWALFLFNLLPIFPLDGGQMLQCLVWVRFGYYKSNIFASITGMIGASLVGVYGLMHIRLGVVFLAVWGFQFCYYRYREFKANGPWGYEDDMAYSAVAQGPTRAELRKRKRVQKLKQQDDEEQVHIDAILAKVSAQGMNSLTFWEKRALHKATEHQRERDAELSKSRGRH